MPRSLPFRRRPPAEDPQTDRTPVPQDLKVMIVAAFVIAVGYGLVAPVLPQFAASFGVGAAASGAVISAFALMRVAGAPAAGPLVTRLGERAVYLWGLGIVAGSSLATAFAPSYPLLLVLRGIGGVGSVMFTVSAMGLIARLSPPDIRGRVSGYYATAFLTGNIMGPVIGAAAATLGLRAPFAIYAAALAVAIAVAAWKLRPTSPTTDTGSIPLPMHIREAWARPTYRALLVSSFANGWTNLGARVAIIPLLGAAVAGSYGASVAGIALAVLAAGAAISQIFLAGTSDRIGRRPVMLTGLLAAAGLTALTGVVPGPWALWGVCLLTGICTGFYAPAQQAALADVVGTRRSGGAVMALFQASSDVGQILAPVLLGAVVDAAGFGPAFLISAALLVLALLAWLPRTAEPARP
ncbi:hypothetical protein BK826_06730 [Rothia kristinae]|uniref:Major facilitator superfamily (MFS) profile domain-containing protein n=2 Tax=Rothia kristinae TaxID=37923 RepID=A0A1S2N1V6_9MICC|nr:MFS transporter [Rothia kristinae]OIJ35721.1 hypothetical protein BK826_06730 [Rothia kristinae]